MEGGVETSVLGFKVAAFVTVIVVSLVGGFLPLRFNVGNEHTRKGVIDHMRFLTAGVFLGVGLLHMLPDAVQGFQALDWPVPAPPLFSIITSVWRTYSQGGEAPVSSGFSPLAAAAGAASGTATAAGAAAAGVAAAAADDDPFPIPYLLCALGFILVWFTEHRFSSSATPSPSPQEIHKMMAVAAGAEAMGGGSICYVQVQPVASYGPLHCPSPTRIRSAAALPGLPGASGLSPGSVGMPVSSYTSASGSASPSPSPSRFLPPLPPHVLSSPAASHAVTLSAHAAPQLGLREALLLGRELEMEKERERGQVNHGGDGVEGAAVLGGRGHRGECSSAGHGHGDEHGETRGNGHGGTSEGGHARVHAHEHDEEDGLMAHGHEHGQEHGHNGREHEHTDSHAHSHEHNHERGLLAVARQKQPQKAHQVQAHSHSQAPPGDCCHSQGHGASVCHHSDQQPQQQSQQQPHNHNHQHHQETQGHSHGHSHGHGQGQGHAYGTADLLARASRHAHEWREPAGVGWRGVQGGTEDDACTGLHRHTHATHHHHIVLPPRGGLSYLLTALLSLHSFVVGAALGTADTVQGTVGLIIALVAHKWAEAFAVGVQFVRESVPVPKMAAILLLYCAMTPLGIVVGILAHSLAGPQAMLVASVTQSFGAGTVLYIAMMELMEKHSGSQSSSFLNLLLLLTGLGIMAAVAAFV